MTVAEGTLAGAALCAAETLRLAILLPAVQYLVGEAAVFDALRRRLPAILRTMAACPSCMGFWLGAGAGLLGVGPWAVGSTPWAWVVRSSTPSYPASVQLAMMVSTSQSLATFFSLATSLIS